MPVSQDQARVLAQLAVDCRPSGARRWDAQGVYAAIGKVKDRHLADVVLAVIRAADDRNAETPGVINAPGSLHWRERGERSDERPAPSERHDPSTLCGTCSLPQVDCERRWADDHPFEPLHKLKARVVAAGIDAERTVTALKDIGALPPEPKPERVFEPPEVPTAYAEARAAMTANAEKETDDE